MSRKRVKPVAVPLPPECELLVIPRGTVKEILQKLRQIQRPVIDLVNHDINHARAWQEIAAKQALLAAGVHTDLLNLGITDMARPFNIHIMTPEEQAFRRTCEQVKERNTGGVKRAL